MTTFIYKLTYTSSMIKELQEIGLTRREAEVYSELAKQGETTANTLAKKTSSNRAGTYNVLQQLIQYGLVKYTKKESHRYYSVTDPKFLVTRIKEKESIAEKVSKQIQSLQSKATVKAEVNMYEGVEGMKIIHEELRVAKKVDIMNATGLVYEHLKWNAEHIVKDMKKNKMRIIANQSLKKTPLYKHKNIPMKFMPKELENYATTIIYKDTVVIQMLKDSPFLIKINNKEISDGYRKIFEFLWKKL